MCSLSFVIARVHTNNAPSHNLSYPPLAKRVWGRANQKGWCIVLYVSKVN